MGNTMGEYTKYIIIGSYYLLVNFQLVLEVLNYICNVSGSTWPEQNTLVTTLNCTSRKV